MPRLKNMSPRVFIAIMIGSLLVGLLLFKMIVDASNDPGANVSDSRGTVYQSCQAMMSQTVDCGCVVNKLSGMGYRSDDQWAKLLVLNADPTLPGAAQAQQNVNAADAACRR